MSSYKPNWSNRVYFHCWGKITRILPVKQGLDLERLGIQHDIVGHQVIVTEYIFVCARQFGGPFRSLVMFQPPAWGKHKPIQARGNAFQTPKLRKYRLPDKPVGV